MRILGMELYRKPKTDAEWVEAVRKGVARSKKLMALYVGGAVLTIAGNVLFWQVLVQLIAIIPGIALGLYIGIMLGAIAGCNLIAMGHCIVGAMQIHQGLRTERLMLRFHDELERMKQDIEKTGSAACGPLPPPL